MLVPQFTFCISVSAADLFNNCHQLTRAAHKLFCSVSHHSQPPNTHPKFLGRPLRTMAHRQRRTRTEKVNELGRVGQYMDGWMGDGQKGFNITEEWKVLPMLDDTWWPHPLISINPVSSDTREGKGSKMIVPGFGGFACEPHRHWSQTGARPLLLPGWVAYYCQ